MQRNKSSRKHAQSGLFSPTLFKQPGATALVLTLVVLCALIPGLIFGTEAYFTYTFHRQQKLALATDRAQIAREHILKALISIEAVAKEVDVYLYNLTDDQIHADEARYHNRLTAIATGLDMLNDILVLNREGRVILSKSDLPVPKNIDLSDREFFRVFQKGSHDPGTPYFSEILEGHVKRRIFFQFSSPRKTSEGDFAGVIAVSVDPGYFSDFFSELLNSGITSIALVKDNGSVLAHASGRTEDLPGCKAPSGFMEALRADPEGGRFEALSGIASAKGQQTVAYQRVPGYPLYAVASLDNGAIYEAWKGDMLRALSIGAPLMLGLLGFGGVALHATRHLEEAEERFRQFGENSSDLLWIMNSEDMSFEYISPAIEDIFGITQEDTLASPSLWSRSIHPNDRRRVLTAMLSLRRGEGHLIEYRILHGQSGAVRWVTQVGFRIAKGRIGGMIRDITEARHAQDQIALLSREAAHRAKNSLAIVQSMILQSAKNNEPQEFAGKIAARIAGLSASLDLLSRERGKGVRLADLARSQLAPFVDPAGSQLLLEGPDLTVEPAAAQTLGMAFHELATNSVKYGSISAGGSVSIQWAIADSANGKRLDVSWIEQGGPEPKIPVRRGFGHTVTVNVVRSSLEAEVLVSYPHSGLVWELSAPLHRIIGTQAEA